MNIKKLEVTFMILQNAPKEIIEDHKDKINNLISDLYKIAVEVRIRQQDKI